MNKEQITEGNKLIAEFIELNLWCTPEKPSNSKHVFNCVDCNCLNPHTLQYHSSWDWLMQACKKIKEDDSVKILLPMNSIPDSIMPYIIASSPITKALIRIDIEKTWLAVIQFITWHNQYKQQSK